MRRNTALYLAFLGVILLAKQGKAGEDNYNYYNDDYGDEDEDEEYLPSVITSKPHNYTLNPGETAILPCDVEHLDMAVIQWRRGNRALYFNKLKQHQDPRYFLHPNNTLVITKVDPGDADIFSCQLVADPPQNLEHRLFVRHPPKIVGLNPPIKPGHPFTVRKGTPLTLMCEAVGFPTPTISWERQGKAMPSGENDVQGSTIMLNSVSRKHNGEYICKAENGVGKPDKASIHIVVQYEPEIEIDKETVNSAEGYETEISCTVHAHPAAEVVWKKDDMPLKASPHHIERLHENNLHILRISGTKKIDFGKYTCVAQNNLGSANKSIIVSGIPTKPALKRIDTADDGSQVVQWTVESRAPITEYEITYKKQESDNWDTIQPPVQAGTGSTFAVAYTFRNLGSGTYQARIKAKNNYGWSQISDPETFAGEEVPVSDREESMSESQLLEAQPKHSSASQIRISIAFVLSLLVARLLR